MKIFIPIKENSQRVRSKNFRPFGPNQIPLYQYVIKKLHKFDVYVDTDSDEIISALSKSSEFAHVHVYRRAAELIGDSVSVCDLIKYFITKNNVKDDFFCQLHVTSPFVDAGLIEAAISKRSYGYDSIISCNKIQSRLWREEHYGYCPINHNPSKLEETQRLPVVYEENSIFYIINRKQFLKSGNRIGVDPFFYPVNFPQNIDIDTEDDWKMACQIGDIS